MSSEERLIRELILQLKLGQIDGEYFRKKFGVEISDRFAGPLAQLEESGMLRRANGEVRLTRQGLLQVDSLLPEFYEARFRDARYT